MDGDGVTQIVSLLYLSGLHLCLLFCLNKVVTLVVHNNLRLLQQFVNLVTDLSSQFFFGGKFWMEWKDSKAAEKSKRACAGGPEGSGSLGHFKGAQVLLWWFVVSHCKALPPRP